MKLNQHQKMTGNNRKLQMPPEQQRHQHHRRCSPTSLTFRLFLTISFTTIPSVTTAESTTVANEFTAHYESTKNFITGHTTVSLKKNNDKYHYKTITTVTGIMSLFSNSTITESSHWQFIKNKIRPDQYLYQRTGSKKRKVELSFDWDKFMVTNNINSDPWRMQIKPETLDKFIYQLAMMRDLQNLISANKNANKNKKSLTYSIADGGKLKTYNIKILGKENIKTKLGSFDIIKVSRTNGKRTTTLWCAEKLGYLPVRINQKKNDGSDYTANIIALEGDPGFTRVAGVRARISQE